MWVRRFWLAGLLALAAVSLASAQDNSTAAAAEGGEENKEEEPEVETKPPLTGNPQIDYKYDPNLPHEVIGYDLSDYPFYSKLPKDLLDPKFNFTCDDRHDGFYASVPHKCQVYHNCLFGVRYDFLCANYTVFDQKNFICHYVSEVDCVNSAKHFDRNDALYVTTTTSTTPRPAPQIIYVQRPPPLKRRPRPNRVRPFQEKRNNKGKRRTTTTMPPPPFYDYDYYDYYEQYNDYQNDYTSERTTTTTTQRPRRRPGGRPNRQRGDNRPGGGDGPFNQGYRKRPEFKPQNDGGNAPRASRLRQASAPREQIFDNAREEAPQVLPQETRTGGRPRRPGRLGQNSGQRRKKLTTTTTTEAAYPDYYYDDYYEYDYVEDKTTTTTTAAPTGRRSRPRSRPGSSGQRARQGRPETEAPPPTTTTTEAPPADEQPSGNRARITNRGSSRRNPVVISRRVAQAEPEEVVPDVPQTSRQRPQRVGPQFPRRRPQGGGGGGGGGEVEIIEEEAPLAPGVNLSPERIRGDATTAEELPRVRRPVPSRQGSDQRPSGRRRARPRVPVPDYYDY